MKYLKRFNEASFDRIGEFIKMADKIINYDEIELEEGDEPSNTDILSELGDLCNELTFTSEELQQVINSGRISDPNNFLQIILDETLRDEDEMENETSEYILLTHHESGDEIHFSLVKSSLYTEINSVIGDDPRKANHSDLNNLLEKIYNERVKHLMCQTYVLEDWPFAGYNIVKVINLPELGM